VIISRFSQVLKKPFIRKGAFFLRIGWLYPDLMGTYGDRGNILVLKKRCLWRNIIPIIIPVTKETRASKMAAIDLLFGGGAQDREQEIVQKDLYKKKGKVITALIARGIPSLFVCGSSQLMGMYYETAEGKKIEGLGLFKMNTLRAEPDQKRCIGNIAVEIMHPESLLGEKLLGFENHGGRTYLLDGALPFAKVISGSGNNAQDRTEGVIHNNAIGTYMHGPLLPKNPKLADYLIMKALEIKYQKNFSLTPLDDSLSQLAKNSLAEPR